MKLLPFFIKTIQNSETQNEIDKCFYEKLLKIPPRVFFTINIL